MTNPRCPDFSSHTQNAAEILFPRGAPDRLTAEQSEAVDDAAEAEYLACEGH